LFTTEHAECTESNIGIFSVASVISVVDLKLMSQPGSLGARR